MRPARPAARGHRVVRALLAPPPGQAAAPRLRRLRRTAAPCRAGPVLTLLAASPGPPVRPGLESRRPAAEPAGLAGRLHRPSCCPARPRPCLHHDHRAGPAAGRRAPRPPAGRSGACPPPRAVDGIPRPGPGGLLHRPRAGAPDRRGRAARRRAAPAAHRCRPRAAAPGRRVVRRVHAQGQGTGPAGRHRAPGRRDDRDRAGDRPRPRPVHGPLSRQARLGAGRRARHRGVPGHPAQGPQAPADGAPPVLPLRPGPEDRARRPDPRAVRQAARRIHRPDSPAGQAARAFPPLDSHPGRSPARGTARHPCPGARCVQPRGPQPAHGRHRPRCAGRPAGQETPPGAARPRQLGRPCSAASPTAKPRPPRTPT